jgi:ATP-dependent Zn protease
MSNSEDDSISSVKPQADKPQTDKPQTDKPQKVDESRLTTAFHEAGHAVMAQIVGRPIEKVSISPAHLQAGGMRLGVCKLQKGRKKSSKDALEDEVMILFAGMVAESYLTGEYCRQGAGQDLRMIRRLLLNRGGSERSLQKLEKRILEKTEHILDDQAHLKAIRKIAEKLVENESVSGRSVRHLLDESIASES